MDGASVFRTFWSVVLPMARPALITLTILSFQGAGTSSRTSWSPRSRPEKRTLVTGLASLTSGRAGRRHPVPAEAGRRVPHDDPGGAAVLRLPATLRPGRQRRRREGLTQRPDRRPPAPLTAVRLCGQSLGQQGTDGGDVGDGTARGEQACPLSPAARASWPSWPRRRCCRWRPSSRRPTPHRPHRPPAAGPPPGSPPSPTGPPSTTPAAVRRGGSTACRPPSWGGTPATATPSAPPPGCRWTTTTRTARRPWSPCCG